MLISALCGRRVLEKVYGSYRNENLDFVSQAFRTVRHAIFEGRLTPTSIVPGVGAAYGASADQAVLLLTGREVRNYPTFSFECGSYGLGKSYVTLRQMASWFNGKAVFANFIEEQNKALCQAMASEKPVIATTELNGDCAAYGLNPAHAYAVLGYQPERKIVLLKDPYGRGDLHAAGAKTPLDGRDDCIFNTFARVPVRGRETQGVFSAIARYSFKCNNGRNMDKTLRIINDLEKEGTIGKYAIGGAIGAMFYAEPAATYDLDIFCYLPHSGLLIDLGPLYKALADKGYFPNKEEQIVIEGIPVQFLVPPPGLVEEALEQAGDVVAFGVPTRVFTYEHLLAIMVETGRSKDIGRISGCLESRQPDEGRLKDILVRHKLFDKWSTITP